MKYVFIKKQKKNIVFILTWAFYVLSMTNMNAILDMMKIKISHAWCIGEPFPASSFELL